MEVRVSLPNERNGLQQMTTGVTADGDPVHLMGEVVDSIHTMIKGEPSIDAVVGD